MSRKRKSGIGQLNVVKAVFALLLLAFLGFATLERLESPVEAVIIKVEGRADNKKLISEEEVRHILKGQIGYDISISNTRGLDLLSLEKYLKEESRIEDVEIYLDKKNRVHVIVIQKDPIIRVEVSGGEDYYLDKNGFKVPLIKNQILRVPIVTGQIDPYIPTYAEEEDHNLNMVMTMAKKVSQDEFLSALVEQIHIDKNDEIVLVPKMGRAKILLGQIDGIDEKMYKLKTYYQKGIKHIGLDKFDELNMKYEGQVLGVTNS
ncbi:MAG: hypothetical protein HKN09_13660 [Saprospiraceae bacterium]|nr:hypothetical protein [Saprospiraceae bacterium]